MLERSVVFTLESCLLTFAKYNTDRCASAGDSQTLSSAQRNLILTHLGRFLTYLSSYMCFLFIISFSTIYDVSLSVKCRSVLMYVYVIIIIMGQTTIAITWSRTRELILCTIRTRQTESSLWAQPTRDFSLSISLCMGLT